MKPYWHSGLTRAMKTIGSNRMTGLMKLYGSSFNDCWEAARRGALKGSSYYQSELEHRQIIEAFGRYPHRNQRLNRPSTQEELAFLNAKQRSFY